MHWQNFLIIFFVPLVYIFICSGYSKYANKYRKKYEDIYGPGIADVDFLRHRSSQDTQNNLQAVSSLVIAALSIPLSAICGALISVALSASPFHAGDPNVIFNIKDWVIRNLEITWPIALSSFFLSVLIFVIFSLIFGSLNYKSPNSQLLQDIYYSLLTGSLDPNHASTEYKNAILKDLTRLREENFVTKSLEKHRRKRTKFLHLYILPFLAFLYFFIVQIIMAGVSLAMSDEVLATSFMNILALGIMLLGASRISNTNKKNYKEKLYQLTRGVETLKNQENKIERLLAGQDSTKKFGSFNLRLWK